VTKFIGADGFGVTEAFRRWCRPLIAGEDWPVFDGLPDYLRLQLPLLPPRLPSHEWFPPGTQGRWRTRVRSRFSWAAGQAGTEGFRL
jgi:hypothetical protein